MIWGSNTINIIENSSIPVLAVPEKIEYSTPSKIVYATVFNNRDIDELKVLSSLAENLQAEIDVIHVTEDIEKADENITLEQYFSIW
jgi:uncharacterized NAD-dependent epimerase/dehydratase family protein